MPAVSDTRVQFHQNGIHMLVINEKQIAIYHAEKLDWFGWVISDNRFNNLCICSKQTRRY